MTTKQKGFVGVCIALYLGVAVVSPADYSAAYKAVLIVPYVSGVHMVYAFVFGTEMHLPDFTLKLSQRFQRAVFCLLGATIAVGTLQYLLGLGFVLPPG